MWRLSMMAGFVLGLYLGIGINPPALNSQNSEALEANNTPYEACCIVQDIKIIGKEK